MRLRHINCSIGSPSIQTKKRKSWGSAGGLPVNQHWKLMPENQVHCDPNLTGNLTAEYDALQNDLVQARALAADYQNQLSDKTNDLAQLKFTLERTLANLAKLQEFIVALRQERHRLANQAMRAVALEVKLAAKEEEVKYLRDKFAKMDAMEEELIRLKQAKRPQIELANLNEDSMVVIATPSEPRMWKSRPPGK